MRSMAWLLLILLGLGWLTSEWPLAAKGHRREIGTQWRRTRDGWERASWLSSPQGPPPATLHPTIVGAVQAIGAVAALIALSGRRGRPSRARGQAGGGLPFRRSPEFGPYRFMEFRRPIRQGPLRMT